MKNGNLYQKLKTAKREESIAWAKRYKIAMAMEKELEEATKPIKEKYEPVLKAMEKDASEKSGAVWDLGYIYHDYGSFSRYDIVNIVAVFLSYIEGEKYIPFSISNSEVCQNSIIIKETVTKQYDDIDSVTLDTLYNNDDLIMLDNGFSSMVDFYNNVGDSNSRFGKFNYLREFVNRLIQYRIDNNKRNEITIEELYSFMCNFLSTHPDLAMKNKDKREQMLMEQTEEDKLISECKQIERKLKK